MNRHVRKWIALTIAAFALAAACDIGGSDPTTTTTSSTTTTTSPSNTTTSTTTVVPASGDETATVQAALETNPAFHVDRTYRIDSTLTPPAGSRITFGPNGKFVRTSAADGTRELPIIRLHHGDIHISDAIIAGPNIQRYAFRGYLYAHEGTGIGGVNPNMEENAGIKFTGGSGYEIHNPKIESVWGDGIEFFSSDDAPVTDVLITNLEVMFPGRSIVSNIGSRDVRIDGGFGYGAYWWGINMEVFGDRSIDGFTVTDFDLGWNRFEQIFAGGPHFNCAIKDVDLTGVRFTTEWTGMKIAACVADEIDL